MRKILIDDSNDFEQTEAEKYKFLKCMYVTFVVALYWFVSILMVFINKHLLSDHVVHLNAPIFITWLQCIITVIIVIIIEKLSIIFPKYINISTRSFTFNRDLIKKILILSFTFASMIASNNLCLKYVDVSFYYIGRSLTTVFNVVFTFIILGEKLSFATISCCSVIICGFILGIAQENVTNSLSTIGVIFGVFASLCVSLYSIETKKFLPHFGYDIWTLSYYNNLYSCFLFLPLMLYNGEFDELYKSDKWFEYKFWISIIISGICGFALGYVSTLQIKVTSALSHNISGTAKSCAQTVLATYYYDEKKTFLWWFCNFLVLGGSAAYAHVRTIT